MPHALYPGELAWGLGRQSQTPALPGCPGWWNNADINSIMPSGKQEIKPSAHQWIHEEGKEKTVFRSKIKRQKAGGEQHGEIQIEHMIKHLLIRMTLSYHPFLCTPALPWGKVASTKKALSSHLGGSEKILGQEEWMTDFICTISFFC